MEELARIEGAEAARGRVILAHLGAGASLAAVHRGEPVETTMAFTPTAGVVMATRTGDIDPGLVDFMARAEGMSPQEFTRMTNHDSGLLGVSETSSDFRDLLSRERDDVRAAEAVALFCYRVRLAIGAFAAALGGLDVLVFSGGIGENSSEARTRICQGLDFLGVAIDEERNRSNAPLLSLNDRPVRVRVIPTDEESIIAKQTAAILEFGTSDS
jgi:acetate kinase